MGLENTGGNSKFVTITGGKFTLRLQDGDDNPDAVERVLGEKSPRAGQTIRELQYNKLGGVIVSAEMKDGNYGVDMVFDIVDGGDAFKLQIPLNSSFFGQITKRLPNVNPAEPIDFFIGKDAEKGKPFVWIKQGGATVKMEHTKDNPNGMPPWGKKMDKGKEVDDPSAQENFLYEVAVKFCASIGGATAPVAPDESGDLVVDEDTVPF